MVLSDLLNVRPLPEVLQLPPRLNLVAAVAGVQLVNQGEVEQVAGVLEWKKKERFMEVVN